MTRKVKYNNNVAFKLQCVKEVLDTHESIINTRSFSSVRFFKSLLFKWIVDYENQGVLGLESKKNQQYSVGLELSLLT